MKKMKRKHIAVAGSLLAILTVASTMAYFTSSDAVTNRFVAGEVSIEVREDSYDSVADKNLAYGQLLNKDPVVYNKGKNDAIVFLQVTIKKEEAVLVQSDGKLSGKAKIPLFDFIKANSPTLEKNQTYDGSSPDVYFQHDLSWIPLENESKGDYITYTFGYIEVVGTKEKTSTLFDQIKLKNVYESESVIGEKNISINAYGIQSAEIPELYDEKGNRKALDAEILESVFNNYFKG